MACHNGLLTPSGEDVSIGVGWRASMMANSARDPYWQASVRRETIDHPERRAEIEDECSICHMPMSRTRRSARGELGRGVRAPPGGSVGTIRSPPTACRARSATRSRPDGSAPASFNGGFVIDTSAPAGSRADVRTLRVDAAARTVMRSATGVHADRGAPRPASRSCARRATRSSPRRSAERRGRSAAARADAVSWNGATARSATNASCQSCHMPAVAAAHADRLGAGRAARGPGRHTFPRRQLLHAPDAQPVSDGPGRRGAPPELEAAARDRAAAADDTAPSIAIDPRRSPSGSCRFDVVVDNLTGHKLPTGYPSRRAWLHVTVRDAAGARCSSRARTPAARSRQRQRRGSPLRFEPHYDEIDSAGRGADLRVDDGRLAGAPTTGLLRAIAYVKDNRMLPRGFDKPAADADIAVHGGAADDDTSSAAGIASRYRVDRRERDWAVHRRSGTLVSTDRLQVGAQPARLRRRRDAPLRLLLRPGGGWLSHRRGGGV